MIVNKYLIYLVLAAFLTACDIPGIITLRNVSDGEATFEYKYSPEKDSIVVSKINIPSNRDSNEVGMIFNFGELWTNERIEEYVSSINYIEIISKTDSIRMSDQEVIINFFKKNRRGLFRNEIYIKIR